MPKATQLVLNLESKPGVLARICRVLSDAGVNIMGLCAAETAGRGKIRILVGDPARAVDALKAAKFLAGQETVLTIALENRPGALAGVAEKLAQARINVKCAYATAAGQGGAIVVLTVANPDKATAVLGA